LGVIVLGILVAKAETEADLGVEIALNGDFRIGVFVGDEIV